MGHGYITSYVDVGEVEVEVSLDEIIDNLSTEELIDILQDKGYNVYKDLVADPDVTSQANRIVLKMKAGEDYSKDLEAMLYYITGKYAS